VRQDLLDQIVWTEVMRLLEDPALIQQELDRRLAVARAADPTKQREQTVQRDLVRVGKNIERMLTAYQEDLLSLEQLRERMPPLRQREHGLRTELQSIAEQTQERAAYLRLAETLSVCLARLRGAADTLDMIERQRIVRLVIKEVLVGDDTIVLRHCISVPSGPPNGSSSPLSGRSNDLGEDRSYLLRTGSDHRTLRRPFLRLEPPLLLHDPRFQPFLDEADDASVPDSVLNKSDHPTVIDFVEKRSDIQIEHPVHLLTRDPDVERIQRIVLVAPGPEPIREAQKVLLPNLGEDRSDRVLDDLVFQRRDGPVILRHRTTAVLIR